MKGIVLKSPEDLKDFVCKLNKNQTLIVDIREQIFVLPGNDQRKLHRIYLNAEDSGVFVNVGWVLNEQHLQCLQCLQYFSFTRRRHHCRCCGNLVCGDCCRHVALIASKESLGLLRVCKQCYRPNEVS